MISDEKRREVVARLREWLAIPWYERPLSRDATQTLGEMVGAVPGENIVERIADLIDRPTCQMKSVQASSYRACSRCGAFVRKDAVTDCIEVIPVRFCPNCGAEVVEEGEDDV